MKINISKKLKKIKKPKEQKRNITDYIYCCPDLLPKTKTRIHGYNVEKMLIKLAN